ncbi:MAG: hypothetical protein KAH25_12240 [Bacteroidales bacterium]|nr:hypothetical protein [Bacteroidales bacterium]
MKNIVEKISIAIVVLITLVVIALIIKYNMIDDEDMANSTATYEVSEVKKVSKKVKTSDYLQNLEKYTDVDVKVDPTKVNNANKVHVISELENDNIQSALKDTDKSDYVKSLKKYTNKSDAKKVGKEKTAQELKDEKIEDDKVRLEKEEIEDDIGNAIGAALE